MKATVIAVAAAIPIAVMASDDRAKWWHGHGHGGGGVAAFGQAGDSKKVSHTINVDMTDGMRFIPSTITVKRGETIRFHVRNTGKMKHEMVLGTEGELEEHYQMMLKMPEMKYTKPNAIALDAGETGEIVWRFTKRGTVPFACLLPGHYDAGMRGVVTVK
ncbi:cupredoxin domain-containing protein [Cupriavidus sp. a3]|uniref:cupredoxin domain-containing protein n=1 Tax=Cupriavidus sp. a3 TaxID=3242158 RepID=UPI003D9C1B1C